MGFEPASTKVVMHLRLYASKAEDTKCFIMLAGFKGPVRKDLVSPECEATGYF